MDHDQPAPSTTSRSASEALRALPSVHDLVESSDVATWIDQLGRSVVVDVVRNVLDGVRAEIAHGSSVASTPSQAWLVTRILAALDHAARPPLGPVVNATGIIIHTGLGRAPLAEAAVEALANAARGYAPVELDVATGQRGQRADLVRDLLCRLTGAESATVVNNNAAALVLTLATIAKDRDVIVSRGELIEIGGSFRLPQIMAAGGARLREVGTTNKTRLSDYQSAIDESVAAILKVHPSNYRIEGFTESPPIAELVKLGHASSVPVVHDIGSGSLRPADHPALAREPDAHTSISAGVDLVMFSGDKLLGGPQAGIIVGRQTLIHRIEKHPLMRAMRLDKLTLSGLGVTLQLHLDAGRAARDVPVHRMVAASVEQLRARANRIAQACEHVAGTIVRVVDSSAYLGGGASPAQAIPSIAIELRQYGSDENGLAARLRLCQPPIITRIHDGAVHFDLRTVFPDQDGVIQRAIETLAGQTR